MSYSLDKILAAKNAELAANILEQYQISSNVQPAEISNLKTHKRTSSEVLGFTYKDRKFYISNDYTLDDNPEAVRRVIQDVNHLLKGSIVKNPIPQSDGAQYALGFEDVEYYLWEDRP